MVQFFVDAPSKHERRLLVVYYYGFSRYVATDTKSRGRRNLMGAGTLSLLRSHLFLFFSPTVSLFFLLKLSKHVRGQSASPSPRLQCTLRLASFSPLYELDGPQYIDVGLATPSGLLTMQRQWRRKLHWQYSHDISKRNIFLLPRWE